MALSVQEKRELTDYNSGEPAIITHRNSTEESDEYNVQLFVRTIIDHVPTYIESVQLILAFPATFPVSSPVVRVSQMRLFHPNAH